MKGIFKDFLKNRRLTAAILLLACGLLILVLLGSGGGEESGEADYKRELEAELAELCSSVDGVGKCRVSVSFKPSDSGRFGTAEKEPEVLGVIVICRGAESVAVRAELTRLFSSLYGIPSTRIAILKLN